MCKDPKRHETYPPLIHWQKTIGGAGYNEANAAVNTTDGGFVVAGSIK